MESSFGWRKLWGVGMSLAKRTAVTLDEALQKNWVEFWFQPKINLREKRLVGLEAFARVRHPEFGVIEAGELMHGANAAAALTLSEQAFICALKAGENLYDIGVVNIRFAINIRLDALSRLPIVGMIHKYCHPDAKPSLIFDVTEKQVMANIPLVHAVAKDLKRNNFGFAIDDFGCSFLATKETGVELDRKLIVLCEKFKQLTGGKFSEMKLERSIVKGCSASAKKRKICENIVSLAHSMGAVAVAIGIEDKKDLEVLEDMGCDIGQGFLLGKPMTQETLLSSLRQRAVKRDKKAAKKSARAVA